MKVITRLEEISKQLKKLATDYQQANLNSDIAKSIMIKINTLRRERNELRSNVTSALVSHTQPAEKRYDYCDRCSNRGMGIHHNVCRGICFKCGRLPVNASHKTSIFD